MSMVIPELDTPAHHILHSLIRHSRRGVDRRSISEIAADAELSSSYVRDIIDDLVAMEVIQRTGEETGLRLSLISQSSGRREFRCCTDMPKQGSGQNKYFRSNTLPEQGVCGGGGFDFASPDLTATLSRCEDQNPHSLSDRSLSANSFLANGGVCSGRRIKHRPTNDARKDSAWGLANYFEAQVTKSLVEAGHKISDFVDPWNHAALRGAFARWKRENDLSADMARQMIDLFAGRTMSYDNKSPWRVFLAKRQELFTAVKGNQYGTRDPEYWAIKPEEPRDLETIMARYGYEN
jgi:DNA-binding MarR family transcriptional regulator